VLVVVVVVVVVVVDFIIDSVPKCLDTPLYRAEMEKLLSCKFVISSIQHVFKLKCNHILAFYFLVLCL